MENLTKDEIKLVLAKAKELREQYKKHIEQYKEQIEQYKEQIEKYKKQREIITKQEITKREQIRTKRKEIEFELLHQKEISKALKTKNFTELIKQENMFMILELARQAIQEEYANMLKQLDDYDNIQYGY